uniref:bromodomain-containing protein 8-like isoform X3 n=1 Tax=Gasterosteus aculeatus aculeatus TaxID=481459 RepID=UPI001A985230|nr:bromodomain-containing protein 8-like isoform X3 [Gasterosteus aculeatus aculeatus]
MKSGDKNWVSVSRAIKPFAEPGRPPDWFSHKHCASKYSELLETAEAPKQKCGAGGEVVETAKDVMVRRLTADRVDALRELIKETQEKHRKLKREAELIQAGCLDSKLEELWGDILQKKKLEEKEAELKRKNTNTAYKARRVAKSTPKPEPGIPVHPPSGCSAPGQVFSPGDPPECLTLDLALTKNPSGSARLAAMAESSGPGNVGPGSLLDDPAQRKLLSQKATAPPSPLLSELLKQGSILATHSRLIGEGDVTTANVTGAHDLQLAPPRQPLTQATERPLPPGCRPVDGEDKVAALGQGDATVSYVGDGLDLKTVGDIIAIIKGETDVTSEALDAQSLCEENGRALSGAGGPGPFHPRGSVPTGVQQASSPHSSPQGKTEVLEAHGGTPASPSSLCISRKRGLAAFPMGPGGLPRTPSSWKSSQQHRAGAPPQPQAMRGAGVLARQKSRISSDVTLKRESGPGPPRDDSVAEDGPLTAWRPKGTTAVTEARGGGEADGAEGCSPGLSDSEDSCSLHAASSSTPRLHAAPDSAPSSPASSQFSVCSDDHESLQAHKMWKKAIMLVWRAAANHRYANVFLQPVTDDIAPGYHGIVQRPVDLAAIKKSIEAGLIRNTAEFQRDIMLMFQNAVMYNSLDHDVNHMALEMQRDVLEQIQQFLATQLIVETSESGTSGKSLSGRESSRKQDAPDEDAVSMSSPAFLLSLFDGGTRGRRCTVEADLKMKK